MTSTSRDRAVRRVHRFGPVIRARVLVADDDEEMVEVVARVLERLGLDVTTAYSGGALLDEVAAHGPFALIVTDVSMPWMSGLQVMHSARAAGMSSPVIVMTGMRDQKTADEVHNLGAQVRRLNKPFTVDELEEAVRASLPAAD